MPKKPPARSGRRVETSFSANHLPRQPKLRKTPPRGKAPKQPPGPPPQADSTKGKNKRAAEQKLRNEEFSAEVREAAAATGLLPHEWLLAVMRGEQLNHYAYDADTQEIVEVIVLPTFSDRMEAAKSAAPYFAEKLQKPRGPAPGTLSPDKRPGVMQVPLADSMQQWIDTATSSQAKLKREVTK